MAAEAATEVAPPATVQAPAAPVAASPEPRAPDKKDAKAKDAKKEAKGGNEGKKKKGTGEQDEDVGAGAGAPSVAAHPRAARGVARAKGWGGLAGFVLGGYLSLPTNTLAGAGARALIAGVVCYVVAWAGAVFVWRRVVILELKAREQQLLAPAKAVGARRELPPAPGGERPAARVAS